MNSLSVFLKRFFNPQNRCKNKLANHSHSHAHSHQLPIDNRRRLWWAFWINAVFLIIEVIGGVITNSLALLSDAGHMLTDVLALGLAIFVSKLSEKAANKRWTFGYMRAEVVGAFINGGTLVFICGFILFEAWRRINDPQPILGGLMLTVAIAGLAANAISAWIIAPGRKDNLNTEGAYLHLMADALGSIGAIVSAVVIMVWNFLLVDVLASVFIALLILWGTKNLLKQSVKLLMDTVPDYLDYSTIKSAILDMDHVVGIHDLHIWSISQNKPALSAHLILSPSCTDAHHWSDCLRETRKILLEKFDIEHCTLQVEPPDFPEKNNCM